MQTDGKGMRDECWRCGCGSFPTVELKTTEMKLTRCYKRGDTFCVYF